MGMEIRLEDGPVTRNTIANIYAGKEIPTELLLLMRNKVMCPDTGILTTQTDRKKVFLVPVSG